MSSNTPAKVTREDLMRLLDGEVTPEERDALESLLEGSSELRREIALFRSMKEDFQGLALVTEGDVSVWGRIRSRITRPIGWILTVTGVVAWLGYGIWALVRSPSAIVVKLATGAVGIGILVLLAHVIWDRYREYRNDPYRHVHQ